MLHFHNFILDIDTPLFVYKPLQTLVYICLGNTVG